MNAIKTRILATATSALLAIGTAGVSEAGDISHALTMKPLHGVSFDVGSKRAISYFLSESGQCRLTLIVAERMKDDAPPKDTPVRFEASIHAGNKTRFDTPEGKGLQFECKPGSRAMSVIEVDQVAGYSVADK
jgi:hypothetical protein